MTLLALASLRSQLGQTPPLLYGAMGWLRPVGEKVPVAEARREAPTANAWSHQPLRSLMPVEFLLAFGPWPRHDVT